MKTLVWTWIILLALLLSSCKDTFDHSVFSAEVPSEYRDVRANNFQKLQKEMSNPEDTASFKIALISDSHTQYDDLQDVINAINMDPDIKFILHGGDMTDGGMLGEFLLFQEIMQQLRQPYFTVIGNHDCLANGLGIYEDMFGPEYYSFVAGNCKFIFFNDVIWELQFREPDYFWLREELANHGNYSHLFVVAHIAPYSDSFTPLQQEVYTTILDTSNVNISIHGHHHDHGYNEYYHDGVMYMTIGAVAKRYYVTLAISPDTVIMERIRF
jgi:3',5'-cyclic AMP phosphodiesterase CpdA